MITIENWFYFILVLMSSAFISENVTLIMIYLHKRREENDTKTNN